MAHHEDPDRTHAMAVVTPPDAEAALVHGMEAGLSAPDWPRLELQELEQLARYVPALRGEKRITWRSPRPFSVAARVQLSAGEFFVKRYHMAVRDVASLLEEHRFVKYLRERAMPVPELLVDEDGGTAFAIDCWSYEVHAAAPGVDAYRDAHSWTPVQSAAHAQSLGKTLAQLHRAAAGFDAPARTVRPLLASFDIVGSAQLESALARFVALRPAVAAFLAQNGGSGAMLDALEPVHAALRPLLPELPAQWIHNDWHASNLFWTDRSADAQVRAVIDFGLCNRGRAVVDLATALERNTVAWLEHRDPVHAAVDDERGTGNAPAGPSIGRPQLAQALLEGYCAVRPLTAAEREALPLLLSLAHVEYALSEVDYFHGVVHNDASARLAYPKFLLGHVRWFGGRQGREYLAGLRRWLRSATRPQQGEAS